MTNKTTHYVIDKELSGGNTEVYREYVEVDREANAGDYFVALEDLIGITRGGVYQIESLSYDSIQHGYIGRRFFDDDGRERAVWSPHKYKTLKPTEVLCIDGNRYRLADRRAEVGEKIINKRGGDVAVVTEVGGDCAYTRRFEVYGMDHGYYYVLLPLDIEHTETDAQTLIANLASEVARLTRKVTELEEQVDSNRKDIVKQAEEFADMKARIAEVLRSGQNLK